MADAAKSDPGLGAPEIGQVLEGRYRLDARLGEGGVGWVFRATHLKLGSEVAIKMLQERFSESSMMRPRFNREAKALAALKHPHIVTITDFSISQGRPYIVMELIEGQTLREVVGEGPLSAERTRRIAHRILDALAFAHERGFVHRDLKPDNVVMLDLDNDKSFPKLLDFGFVKLTDESPTPSGSNQDVLTRSGIAFGTPAYMSPEQATGGDADERSDIYSLGVMLFEMLTGRRPYEGTLPEIVRAHLTAPIPTFEQRGTRARETVELRNLFTKALAKEPEQRFQSAGEMRAAIDALPAHFVRYVTDEKDEPDETVSVEAPTVAAVPSSKQRQAKSSGWRMLLAMLIFVSLVGGVAGLVALGAMASQDEAETLLGSEPRTTEPEPLEIEASDEHRELVTEAVDDEEPPIEEVEGPDMEFGEDELLLSEEELAEAERELEAEEPAEAPAEEVDRRHPWQTKRRVNFLTQARRRVLRGRALSAGAERNLKRWVRNHRDDPRPHLLIAQSYMAKGWGRSAFDRYQLAQRVDPRSRFDPRMARDLVRIASESSVADAAAEYVVETYGRDALEPIERELGRASISDEARARLERLRDRIHAI